MTRGSKENRTKSTLFDQKQLNNDQKSLISINGYYEALFNKISFFVQNLTNLEKILYLSKSLIKIFLIKYNFILTI